MRERRHEEAELVARGATGEPEALLRLMTDNAPMVHALARRLSGQRQSREDLVHEGYLGLLRAVDRYDPDKGTRFSTYARHWVRYYQQRFARENRRVVTLPRTRNMVKARNGSRRVRRDLEQELGERVSDDVVARILGVDVEDVAHARMEHSGADISMHADANELHGVQISGDFPDPETAVGELEEARSHHTLLAECLKVLDARERRIVDEHILSEEKHTLSEIGEELGVSRERVRQLEKRALRKMRALIETQHPEQLTPTAAA